MKLDLGCGMRKKTGFVGIDISKKGTQADIAWDLEKYPYPFKAASVDEIFCSHYIEHVPNLMKFMNELWRITVKGAQLEFIAPYYTSVRATQDPTHVRYISENSFFYFDKAWRKDNKLEHYPIQTNFKLAAVDYHINVDFKDLSDQDLLYASRHMWNVYDDIHVILKKP